MMKRTFKLKTASFAILSEKDQRSVVTIPAQSLVTVVVGKPRRRWVRQDPISGSDSIHVCDRPSDARNIGTIVVVSTAGALIHTQKAFPLRRPFIACSPGLFPTPSSHDLNRLTLTVRRHLGFLNFHRKLRCWSKRRIRKTVPPEFRQR